jgi:hypothetical protein
VTVLVTQNLLTSMCTIIYQNLGGIGVTPNESNRPESNGPSAGVTLTKFVCGLNPMRTRWIRHSWIGQTSLSTHSFYLTFPISLPAVMPPAAGLPPKTGSGPLLPSLLFSSSYTIHLPSGGRATASYGPELSFPSILTPKSSLPLPSFSTLLVLVPEQTPSLLSLLALSPLLLPVP